MNNVYYNKGLRKGIIYINKLKKINSDIDEKIKTKQIYVSPSVIFFKDKLKEKYNLVDYYDFKSPAIFNGVYSAFDINKILNHKGVAIVIWCGNDALKLTYNNANRIKLKKDIRHIAKSEFVYNSLKKYNIISDIIPVTPTTPIINYKPKGDKVYFYYSKRDPEKYGYNLMEEVESKVDIEIIKVSSDMYSKKQLDEIYEKCFIGLRLTKHDGLPNTVLELGLMGRKCVYNGNLPNALKYKSSEDIINHINNEYQLRNINNECISEDVFNYININNNWMYV
jgi:hypothetical protein